VITWFGILSTGGTPTDIVNRLNKEIVSSLGETSVKEQIAKLGMETVGNSPEQYSHLPARGKRQMEQDGQGAESEGAVSTAQSRIEIYYQ